MMNLHMVSGTNTDHRHHHIPQTQHGPWSSTWLQVTAQTMVMYIAFGDNMGHGHPRGPWPQQDYDHSHGP